MFNIITNFQMENQILDILYKRTFIFIQYNIWEGNKNHFDSSKERCNI